MMEKRMRKVAGIEAAVPPPVLWGPRDADVTLIGWGSTKGVGQLYRYQKSWDPLPARGLGSGGDDEFCFNERRNRRPLLGEIDKRCFCTER
jgi:hypothetical protein